MKQPPVATLPAASVPLFASFAQGSGPMVVSVIGAVGQVPGLVP